MARGEPTSVQAKTGYGFKFYVDMSGKSRRLRDVEEWTWVEGMRSGALPSPDQPEIDVTTTTDEVKAYIPGIGSINDIALEFNFYPGNDVHQTLVGEYLYEESPRPWKIEGQGMSFTFWGYLKSSNVSFGVDAALQMPLTLKVTTKPIVVWDKETGTEPDPDLPEPDEGETDTGGEDNSETGSEEDAEIRAARMRAAAKHS